MREKRKRMPYPVSEKKPEIIASSISGKLKVHSVLSKEAPAEEDYTKRPHMLFKSFNMGK